MSMLNIATAILELCVSSIWGLFGFILGLAVAIAVLHLSDSDGRYALAAFSFCFALVFCLLVGHLTKTKD
jgi:hypothetical protein